MKRIFKVIICLIMSMVLFLLPACENKKKEIDFKWSDISTAKYRDDENVNYLITVKYVSGYDAKVTLFEKDKSENNAWTIVLECDGIVGKNGIGKTKEGDNLAPKGDFPVLEAFGIKQDPGTLLEYTYIDEDTYACEDKEHYNNIINITENPHECNGEHMIDYSPEYNYGFKIGYNEENKPGLGSSIFFHCKGAKSYTGGCIAVAEDYVKEILQTIDNTTRVIIDYTD